MEGNSGRWTSLRGNISNVIWDVNLKDWGITRVERGFQSLNGHLEVRSNNGKCWSHRFRSLKSETITDA